MEGHYAARPLDSGFRRNDEIAAYPNGKIAALAASISPSSGAG